MNILVTGAAGYVGSVCAAELVRQRHHVVAYDNLTKGHRQAVVDQVQFVRGDIADTEKLKRVCKKYQIEAVMHFAASALIDESTRNPHLFYRNNVSGTLSLSSRVQERRWAGELVGERVVVGWNASPLALEPIHPRS
jgi:UDP-glucose 4-epimerase